MHTVLIKAKVALKVTFHLFLYGSSSKSRQDLRMLYILTVVCDVLQFDFVIVLFCFVSLLLLVFEHLSLKKVHFLKDRICTKKTHLNNYDIHTM